MQVPSKLNIWKTIGDEIVFENTLTTNFDALFYCQIFKEALITYRKRNLKTNKHDNITLKASAWVACFPIFNIQLDIESATSVDTRIVDYIGSTIDAGFRISKLATKRKFVISVELSLILLSLFKDNGECVHDEFANQFRFFYDGKEQFKGVLRNTGYPVIWLDTYDGEDTEEVLKGFVKQKCSVSILKKFCYEFVNKLEEISDSDNAVIYPIIIPAIVRNYYSCSDYPRYYSDFLKKISEYAPEITESQLYEETLNEVATTNQNDQELDELKNKLKDITASFAIHVIKNIIQ